MFTQARFLLLALVVAIILTFLFWWPLYGGAGFIGGDLYPYFFPQKAFYADRLKLNEFPLWNDLSGFGYPVLGESQTGAAYPFHLIFYRLFEINMAYNIEHLLHYVMCFVATALFAKRLGLSNSGSLLSALVFTYGWFPPRACLEWAILTGAYFPVALWCVESFLQTRYWRYAIGLSIAIGLQLLAGHYHLAFITQLVVATYSMARLWIERRKRQRESAPLNESADLRSEEFNQNPLKTPHPTSPRKAGARSKTSITPQSLIAGHAGTRTALALVLAILAGIGLSAVQLLPTWELKQRSSRVVISEEYDPAYGHMPPLYVSQLIVPWFWYSPNAIDEDNVVRDLAELVAPWHWFGPNQDLDVAIQQSRFAALTTGTNKVEAHVYCGLLPILMAGICTLTWLKRITSVRTPGPRGPIIESTTAYWLLAGLFGLIYATGWLLPIGRQLPGFGYFRGPGRYGMITTFSVAMLAGQFFSTFLQGISSRSRQGTILALVFVSTCGDLWLVSRMVTYSFIISRPAISFRHESIVRERLQAEAAIPRLLAPGPNVGNLLGVSCVPWYLGIAPSEYVDRQLAMPPLPKPLADGKPAPCSPELLEWLSRSGVTHVLNFDPLDESSWQAELMWTGIDPFLNRVWGRPEPIYLYRFRKNHRDAQSPFFAGRAYLAGETQMTAPVVDWKEAKSESRRVVVEPGHEGNLILTELAYPGWTVQQNGHSVDAKQAGLFRSVECSQEAGDFVWTYRPSSVYYGAIISLISALILAAIGHIRFWHPQLTQFGGQTKRAATPASRG